VPEKFPPKGSPPEESPSALKEQQLQDQLVLEKTSVVRSLMVVPGGFDERLAGYAEAVAAMAAEFFDYSRSAIEDFCYQAGSLENGVVIFGGTNRLIWSLKHGFRLDESYCTQQFKDHFAYLISQYPNGRLAIQLVDEDGAPVVVATINVPEFELADDQVIIKDYSENAGIELALVKAGLIEVTGRIVPVGYVTCMVSQLTLVAIKEACSQLPSLIFEDIVGIKDHFAYLTKDRP
jgi:hypothetical protein